MTNRIFALTMLPLALVVCTVHAEVRLPALFAEHMVVQRDVPVHIWGLAAHGEEVRVTFRDATRTVTADRLGQWDAWFPAGAKGGPFVLEIMGSNHLSFPDVLVGDVWLASGQSNMEFRTRNVTNAENVLMNANQPNIRLFQVQRKTSASPQTDVSARTWTAATRESVSDFSAVGFLFARELSAEQQAPIGVIESDFGGTPAEAWTSLPALTADASLMPVFATYARLAQTESVHKLEKQFQDAQRAQAKAEGKPEPQFPWRPALDPWTPAALYNGMVAPLTPFPIRGVIWYQGESNGSLESAPSYQRLFETLIRDWRSQWNAGDFPFLFVQLANFKPGPGSAWPKIREAQRRALALKNTGMAVTIDIGDPEDVHPRNKQDVAHRLALAARALAYGEALEYSGPAHQTVSVEGSLLRVVFAHAEGLRSKDAVPLGFEIAGSDRQFVAATAKLEQNSVVLSNPAVTSPVYARYGWDNSPECNLVNSAGLPASPFTTEP